MKIEKAGLCCARKELLLERSTGVLYNNFQFVILISIQDEHVEHYTS